METDSNKTLFATITGFINDIGIPCKEGTVKTDSFLPGVDIVNGGLIYDAETILSPGDLLHEAGHVAVLSEEDRADVNSGKINGDIDEAGVEMAAIAWSWAALTYLDVAPEVVFHEHGYKGSGETIIKNFSEERYLGVSLLQWWGMTNEPQQALNGKPSYPNMEHWLRPS